MSILFGKKALIISSSNDSLQDLERLLKTHQMDCGRLPVSGATPQNVKEQTPDIVFVDLASNEAASDSVLSKLCKDNITKSIPVFAVIKGGEDQISRSLMLGAADYLKIDEDVSLTIKKVKMILGQPDTLSGPLIFEVPPDMALTTKKGVKVFIIENDPLLRNLLKARLDASSFTHEFAEDGNGVLEKIVRFSPQVVILDLMLPGKSGFEILEEIRQNPTLKTVPVIVFSNRDSNEDRKRVADLGIDRFFVKAMTDLSVLVEAIEELVS